MSPVGNCIRSYRLAAGLSQRGLAEKLCDIFRHPTLTRHEIHRWGTGRRLPSQFWFWWLVKALDAPTQELKTLWLLTRQIQNAKRRLATQQAKLARHPLTFPAVPLPSVGVYGLRRQEEGC